LPVTYSLIDDNAALQGFRYSMSSLAETSVESRMSDDAAGFASDDDDELPDNDELNFDDLLQQLRETPQVGALLNYQAPAMEVDMEATPMQVGGVPTATASHLPSSCD
jgi:hypothetical protein